MSIPRALAVTLVLAGIAMIACGALPKFGGGHFRREYVFAGMLLVYAGRMALRRIATRSVKTIPASRSRN